jgi:hypothetical protein
MMSDSELTIAMRNQDFEALKRLGCTVDGKGMASPTDPLPPVATTACPVEAGVSLEDGRLTIMLPLETKSEANQRGWKGKARRTKSARRILFQTVGPHHWVLTPFVTALHSGEAIRVLFTRLGGRRLDDDNLRSAFKAARDGVAAMLLADDGDPRFHWEYDQAIGGPVGIRIEIEVWR